MGSDGGLNPVGMLVGERYLGLFFRPCCGDETLPDEEEPCCFLPLFFFRLACLGLLLCFT